MIKKILTAFTMVIAMLGWTGGTAKAVDVNSLAALRSQLESSASTDASNPTYIRLTQDISIDGQAGIIFDVNTDQARYAILDLNGHMIITTNVHGGSHAENNSFLFVVRNGNLTFVNSSETMGEVWHDHLITEDDYANGFATLYSTNGTITIGKSGYSGVLSFAGPKDHIFEASITSDYGDYTVVNTNRAQLRVTYYKNIAAAASVTAGGYGWKGTDNTGATLKLLTDVTTTSTVEISGEKVLDLNGCGLTKTGSTGSVLFVGTGANLVMVDNHSDAPVRYYTPSTSGPATLSDSETEYSFTGGYITGGIGSTGSYGGRWVGGGVNVVGGNFTMNGGTIFGNGKYEAWYTGGAVQVTGDGESTGVFTMNGGALIGNAAQFGSAIELIGYKPYAHGPGECTINGGEIKHNAALYGTIRMCQDAYVTVLNINGGSITNNVGGGGAAVLADLSLPGDAFTMSGNPVIKDNYNGDVPSNIYLSSGQITITGALDESAIVGMTMRTPGVFTNSADTTLNDLSKFFSDDDSYLVLKNAEGQLALGEAVAMVTTSENATTKYTVLADAVAHWVDGSTLKLLQDITVDNTIVVPSGTLTFDLNGHGILMTGNKSVLQVGNESDPTTNLTMIDSDTTRVHYVTLSDYHATAVANTGTESVTNGTGTVKINGGYIAGGQTGTAAIGGSDHLCGGGIYVGRATFTMKAGNIIGNKVNSSGGGIHVGGGADAILVVDGGRICYNSARISSGGVNVGINGWTLIAEGVGKFTMNGGQIDNNYSVSTGDSPGGGATRLNNGELHLNGGSIINNRTAKSVCAGILYDLPGGCADNINHLYVSGNPVLKDNYNETGIRNLYLNTGTYVTVEGEMGGDAFIGVTMATRGVFTNSSNTDFNNASKFFSDDANYSVWKNTEGQLKLGVPPVATVTADGTTTEYDTFASALEAWVDGSKLTLLKDLETASSITIPSETTKTIDLNNHSLKLTSTTGSLFVVRGNLTMEDNSTTKTKHYYTLSATQNAAATLSESVTTYSFRGGYITSAGGGTKSEGNTNYSCGANVFVASTGHFTLKSGTIFGGGSGFGNTSSNGGGVYVDGLSRTDVSKQGLFTMDGGTVCGCYCPNSGGGLATGIGDGSDCYGRIVVNDGTIKDNISRWGSGIITDNGYLEFHGGTITGNISTATDGGAAIYGAGYSTYVITGGRITGNRGPACNYGAICIKKGFDTVGTELLLSGNPYIAKNYSGDVERNLSVNDVHSFITVDGELTNTTPIGITLSGWSGVFTNSTDTSLNVLAKFVSDDKNLSIAKTADGQLMLGEFCAMVTTSAGVTTRYTAFADALTAWVEGSKLTLLADVEISNRIDVTSEKTFDLNGFGLRQTVSPKTIFWVDGADAKLTIEDSNPTRTGGANRPEGIAGGYITGGSGDKTGTYRRGGALNIDNFGYCKMTGGTFTGNTADFGGAVQFWKGTFEMVGGTITGNSVAESSTYHGGGGVWAQTHDAKFIMGGTAEIYGNNGAGGYYNCQVMIISSDFIISGGSPKIHNSASDNNLFLKTGDQDEILPTVSFTGEPLSTDAIIHINSESIIDQVFTVGIPDLSAAYSYVNSFVSDKPDRAVVVDHPTHQLAFASASYVASISNNETTVYYQTLEAAVTDWVDGTILHLLKDVETASTITVPAGDHTLDLNGCGLTMTGSTGGVLYVGTGANLVMVDNHSDGPVRYYTPSTSGPATLSDSETEYSFTGGYITGGIGTYQSSCQRYVGGGVYVKGGKFTMNGGTIFGNGKLVTAYTGGGMILIGDGEHTGEFTMNGGAFIGNVGQFGAAIEMIGVEQYAYGPSTCTINGGLFKHNVCSTSGSAIRISTDAYTTILHLNGGTITENTGTSGDGGGAVMVGLGTAESAITLSGNVVINGNVAGNHPSNLRMHSGKATIVGSLGESANIGVTMPAPGVFTNSADTTLNDLSKFFSDNENYIVRKSADNQLELYIPPVATVTVQNSTIEYSTIAAAVAAWVDGSTLTLLRDITVDNTIVVPSGTLTFDLNGHGILMTGGKTVLQVGNANDPTINLTMIDSDSTRVHYVTLEEYHATAVADTGTVSVTNGTGTVKIAGGYIAGGQTGLYCVGNRPNENDNYIAGAGICVGRATFTMKAGTIIGNTISSSGGGIHVDGTDSHVVMDGGRICYNYATGAAGAVNIGINGYVKYTAGFGKFTMNGGVLDNNCAGAGGAIRINNGELHLNGGSIINNTANNASYSGGIYYDLIGGGADNKNYLYVSGNPVLKDNSNANGNSNLYLTNGACITVEGAMGESAQIGVSMQTPGVFTNTQDTALNVASKFFNDDYYYTVRKNVQGQLTLAPAPVATVTADGTTTEYTTLNAAVAAWVEGSTLTLLKDVQTSTRISTPTGNCTLDLNGCGLKMTGSDCVIYVGASSNLVLTDSDPDRSTHYYSAATSSSPGSVTDTQDASHPYSFTGGYITGGIGYKYTASGGTVWREGGAVYTLGTFTMNGGTLVGNYVRKDNDIAIVDGGSVCVGGGTFTLNDGTAILAGQTSNGAGGVKVEPNSKFIMAGGIIKHCYGSYGPAVRSQHSNGVGDFIMTGGTITENAASGTWGAVSCEGNCTVTITGGSVINNKCGGVRNAGFNGGKVTIGGNLVIKDNAVSETDDTPCNLYILEDRVISVSESLGADVNIGVTMQTPGVFTNSENTDFNDASKFFSDNEDYIVLKNVEKQLKLGAMPVATITANGTTTEYETLAEAVAAWVDGSTLTLLKDVETATTITVSTGDHTLDLNGHGILQTGTDKVISVPSGATLNVEDNGSAEHYITLDDYHATSVSNTGTETTPVEGTGVVKVSGGYLAGGKSAGLHVAGTLNMTGGTVIGNYYNGMGGAMIMTANGNVTLAGNSQVIYNKATGWGGAMQADGTLTVKDHAKVMYNYGHSGIHFNGVALNLAGSPTICDNVVVKTGRGIRVEQKLSIVGPLTGAKISVNLNNFGDNMQSREGQLTNASEYVDENTAGQFICENDGESGATIVRIGQELWVTSGYSISYLANGGTGSVIDDENPYAKGSITAILGNSFTAPDGMIFAGWNTEADGSGVAYEAGDMYEVVGNLALYAQWEWIPYILAATANDNEKGTVEVEGLTANADGTFTVHSGSEVTIKATAAVDCHLESWSNGAEVNEAGTIAVVVTSDTSIVANFASNRIRITPVVTLEGWRYGETPKRPVVTGNEGNGPITYTYAPKGSDNFTDSVPTQAGNYIVKVTIGETEEYAEGEATVEFTIGKASITTATVTIEGWTFGETAKTPVLTGNTSNGTVTYVYAPKGSNEFSATVPTAAGNYVVKAIIGETANYAACEATAEFTIAKATSTEAVVTIEGWKYGEPSKTPTVTGNEGNGNVTYVYARKGSDHFTDTVPTEAGDYIVKAIIAESENYVGTTVTTEFTIGKAPSSDAVVTIEGWKYGEPAKTPTVTGNGGNGTVTYVYARKGSDHFTDTVPTEAGDYIVKAIVAESENYEGTTVTTEFTIAKATSSPAVVTIEGWKYGEPSKTPTISGNTENGTVTYVYARKGSDHFTDTVPTEAGDYIVKAIIGETANYAETEVVSEFTIAKATPVVELANWTYGSEPSKPTITSGKENCTVTYLYARKGSDEFSETVPTAAGDYIVKAVVSATDNYEGTTVTSEFTIERTVVTVSGVQVATAKVFDGTTAAEVIKQGSLLNVQGSDELSVKVTASYDNVSAGSGKTITVTYTLVGSESVLANYALGSTTVVYSRSGYIAEPIVMNSDRQATTDHGEMRNGFEIDLYGYCNGNSYSLQYYLGSGDPDQYKVEFADSRLTNVDWTDLVTTGVEGTIELDIPVDLPSGDYSMKVTFRDSHYAAFESEPMEVSFHVNLPETYTVPLFDNVIAVVDTCECLTDIQWYHRDNSNMVWQAIEGANDYYYRQEGGLSGEYFISAKMNGAATYTCPQTDVTTLYGSHHTYATVRVSPNPVVNNAQITIEGSESIEHNLRVVNIMGNEVEVRTFNGNSTTINMDAYPTGRYIISVDGIVVNVIRK